MFNAFFEMIKRLEFENKRLNVLVRELKDQNGRDLKKLQDLREAMETTRDKLGTIKERRVRHGDLYALGEVAQLVVDLNKILVHEKASEVKED